MRSRSRWQGWVSVGYSRARYSSPAVLPTGPRGDTVAASSGQGKIFFQTAERDGQAEEESADAVSPPEHLLGILTQPPMATTSSVVAKMHTSINE